MQVVDQGRPVACVEATSTFAETKIERNLSPNVQEREQRMIPFPERERKQILTSLGST